jgi:hypothetical protein
MCSKIHLRSIRMAQLQALPTGKFLSQHAHHVSVELNRQDVALPLEQRMCEGTEAGSKLDDLAAHRGRGVRNPGCRTRLYQEVLRKRSLGEEVVFPKEVPRIG